MGMTLIPFPRDDNFVDRAGTIDQIKEMLEEKENSPRVALVGLGGVG
jgi:hypothetical protein